MAAVAAGAATGAGAAVAAGGASACTTTAAATAGGVPFTAAGDGWTHICYHYPCPDGIGAALAAFFGCTRDCPPGMADDEAAAEMRIKFVPLAVYRPEAERVAWVRDAVAADDVVYIVDFSGGLDFIRAACAAARRVVVLDHHKTAQAEFAALVPPPPNLTAVFDMDRSGVGLARDYFQLVADDGAPAAWLASKLGSAAAAANCLRVLAYLQDNDLWRHALPGSKDFTAGLHAAALRYELPANLSVLRTLAAASPDALIAAGAAARAASDRVVAAAVARACTARVPLPGGAPPLTCLAVVMPDGDLRSALGNALAAASRDRGLAPVGIVAYTEPAMPDAATAIKVSMRGCDGYDTTPATTAYGGGGHAAASSCIVPRAVYDAWTAGAAP